jgi:hypothetical protein
LPPPAPLVTLPHAVAERVRNVHDTAVAVLKAKSYQVWDDPRTGMVCAELQCIGRMKELAGELWAADGAAPPRPRTRRGR